MTETILPRHSTLLEVAYDLASAARLDLPVDIGKLHKPYEVPLSILPYAAFGVSTDLWSRVWDEERQRNALARAIPWHRIKGTEAALREAVTMWMGQVRSITVPPATTYLMPSLTDAERLAFLSRFAQVRIYPYFERATARFFHFTTAAANQQGAFMGVCYPATVGAQSRYRAEARLWDKGVETSLTTREVVTTEFTGQAEVFDEVVFPAVASAATFPNGGAQAAMYLAPSLSAQRRLMTVPRSTTYSYRIGRVAYSAVMPSAGLIYHEPEVVSEQHPALSGAVFPGDAVRSPRGYLPPSAAWRHIYRRLYVHDPERLPDSRPRTMHLGYTRLSMPAFHAEVRARVKCKRPVQAVSRFLWGHTVASSPARLDGITRAVAAATSLRDKVLLTTKTYRTIQAGDRLKPSEAKVGQLIEV